LNWQWERNYSWLTIESERLDRVLWRLQRDECEEGKGDWGDNRSVPSKSFTRLLKPPITSPNKREVKPSARFEKNPQRGILDRRRCKEESTERGGTEGDAWERSVAREP